MPFKPTHGMSRSRVYGIYHAMKKRCYKESHWNYESYGGRGIKICNRWLESFENFLNDMGEPPTDEHTIDRVNFNGDYEPSNCRWASKIEQNRNRSNTVWIEYEGVKLPMKTWAERIGIKYATLHKRLHVYGYSIERALTEGVNNVSS